jgi:hypothetical protein
MSSLYPYSHSMCSLTYCSDCCGPVGYPAHFPSLRDLCSCTKASEPLCYYQDLKFHLLYPSLKFHFNRKDAINAELDIYIPSLKLAFELNGIFHYEPIYGPEKLAQIQTNDERKFQACLERGIELCLIDVSSFSYFKLEGAKRYLNIVTSILNENISKLEGETFRPD